MKLYALARKDGGVTILQAFAPVAEILAKWHPDVLNQHTGEIKEVAEFPDRAGRTRAWFESLPQK